MSSRTLRYLTSRELKPMVPYRALGLWEYGWYWNQKANVWSNDHKK